MSPADTLVLEAAPKTKPKFYSDSQSLDLLQKEDALGQVMASENH